MSISEDLTEIVTSLCTPRDQQVLVDRMLCLEGRATLSELGKRLNVTQERVRQIEDNLRRRLISKKHYLSEELSNSIEEFANKAGEAFQLEDALQFLSSVGLETGDAGRLPATTLLFLHYAGPYKLHKSLLIQTRLVGKLELLTQRLWNRLQKNKVITVDDADDMAKELEIRSPDLVDGAITELQSRHSHIYEANAGRYSYGPTAADRAYTVLTDEAQPIDIESLSARSDTALPTLLNAIAADPRIIRVNRRTYGLASWGLEEYEGIVASIHRALHSLGGSAKLYDVADWVAERFNVSWTSVITYAASHHDFVLTQGILRIRRPDEEARGSTNTRELGETAGCLLVDGCPTLRVTIDEHLCRGSGRPIPRPWAIKAGVRPGERLFLRSGASGVVVSWYGTEPTLGSLRDLMFHESWPDRGLGFLILKGSGLSTLTVPPPPSPSTEPSTIAAAIGSFFAFVPPAEGHPLAGSFWEALGESLGLQATQRVPGVILARLASRREPLVTPYVDALRKALLMGEARGLRVQVDH